MPGLDAVQATVVVSGESCVYVDLDWGEHQDVLRDVIHETMREMQALYAGIQLLLAKIDGPVALYHRDRDDRN